MTDKLEKANKKFRELLEKDFKPKYTLKQLLEKTANDNK